jgi:hypothetical protein
MAVQVRFLPSYFLAALPDDLVGAIRLRLAPLAAAQRAMSFIPACLGCATHALPGHMPLVANIYGPERELIKQLVQG